jgi:hypothetical protein
MTNKKNSAPLVRPPSARKLEADPALFIHHSPREANRLLVQRVLEQCGVSVVEGQLVEPGELDPPVEMSEPTDPS